ncbi:tRNA (adenosine(37)-N6)-dimethylallyltransferase MiaA [Candidatus Gracilibacteria bacterium]|nr:tRNA (adenosine(37)-N6)-dimethylallyltransferase MiaA [Candidatus Gracilibacteria bacterium]
MIDLNSWLSIPSDKPKLLVIYGPTACGKTALTIELARKYNGEVINADSRQIYRGMNIGTGKVTEEEMQSIPHHMLDIRDISELYGVGEFAPEARRIIDEIHARGKLPILSGGTGLFIDSVVGNFTIPEVVADWGYRDELEAFRLKEGNDALWEKLYAVDPDYASDLDPRNYRYVIRGLEIWRETGQSKKLLGQKTESPYDFYRMTPYDGNREKLYETINKRVELMFQTGLIEEVQQLMNNEEGIMKNDGILKELPGLNAIGYREVLDFLADRISLEQALESVQTNSRHYAKRQLTWFRRYNDEI